MKERGTGLVSLCLACGIRSAAPFVYYEHVTDIAITGKMKT
jgi:hypothetical protein